MYVLKRIGYHITYNSEDGYYEVSKGDVSAKFYKDEQGLPYINVIKQGVLVVQKVQQNYEGYTNKKVDKAALACKASGILGHTLSQDLEYLVSSNNIDDCPITVNDLKNDHASFGHDIAEVRGKTVMHKPDHTTICYVEIPR